MSPSLEGVRVLDLTRSIHGALGVMMLADHGADVVKIEPPGGDPFRATSESPVWHRGRRSAVIDLKSPKGKDDFLALAAEADVLVETFRPATMGRLGLDHASINTRCPRLVYLSAPAYPALTRHASRPGWDALVQARSGLQYEQPGWREGPIFLQNASPSMATAYLVPIAVLAALSAREQTGRGQHVETSIFQGAMALTTMLWIHAEHGQNQLEAVMAKTYPPGVHQRSVYECADGWVHATGGRTEPGRQSMTAILGLPDDQHPMMAMMLAAQGTPAALAQAYALQQKVAEAFKRFKVSDLVEAFHVNGLGAEAIVPMGDVLRHPQLTATDSVVQVSDPEVGDTTQLGVTIKLSRTPGQVRGPRPTIGQHTDEVVPRAASRGRAGDAVKPAVHPAGSPAGSPAGNPLGTGSLGSAAVHPHALSDVRVLDFGRAFAGPFACMVLASLGADVIKVEAPGAVGVMGGGPQLGCQQGKRVIAVDMKRPEGRRILDQLVARTDVVHHNMTKGVAERLGIDQTTLERIKPDIITCNTFMYGPEGPLSELGGLDPLAQAAAGLEYEAGPVGEGNAPLWYRFGHGDTANALASVVGVLLALHARKRTGAGQSVWTSLLHGTAVWGSGVYLAADGTAVRPLGALDQRQTGFDALYRLYETHGGWIQLAAVKPEHWPSLCTAIARSDLVDDPRFSTAAARRANRTALETELEPLFRGQTALQWRRHLDAHGVPSEIAVDTNDGETVLFDEENVRLGLVASYDHPTHGKLRQVGQLVTFEDTPGRVERPPSLVTGEHTVEILRELGYEDGAIRALRDSRVIEYPEGALDR